MPESLYCHVVDVLRKFNPQLDENSLEQEDYLGNEDTEQIRARIEGVSQAFEDNTGRAYRLQKVGAPGTPETYEYPRHKGGKRKPLRVYLRGYDLLPFDPDEGDSLELRIGRTSWREFADDLDRFDVDHRNGRVTIYRRALRDLPGIWRDDDRLVRASYRHGALGGSRDSGGETTLESSLSSGDTGGTKTINVSNASRLPSSGTLLIGSAEYVRIHSVNYSEDSVDVTRAVHATTKSDVESGAPVHYCPERIREAVAARTAQELVRYDDWVEEIIQTDADAVGASEKIEGWQAEWEQTLAKHSAVRRL